MVARRPRISCISRCNLALSFCTLAVVWPMPNEFAKAMRTRSLNSEAHNGIQRLRGFLGRWFSGFSQLYDKLSESAELRLKGGGPSCELLPSLGVDVFCFIGYPGNRPRSLRATRSALLYNSPRPIFFSPCHDLLVPSHKEPLVTLTF